MLSDEEKKVRDERLYELTDVALNANKMDMSLYQKYDVKRGLRESNGRGVLTGLTEISDVNGRKEVDGKSIPIEGELYFQGYKVGELVAGNRNQKFNFEEVTYLLLFGNLPTKAELKEFIHLLSQYRELPSKFVRDVILKAPSKNIMNGMQRSVLTLYSYDKDPDDTSIQNVLRQSLQLIGVMPLIAVYNYHAYQHYNNERSLIIRYPSESLSTAENILRMLRDDGAYTELEARVLDECLVIHSEHGGGNNSTFTTHVVSSTGTDTYSSVAASLASLKGPKHGGANLKVEKMFTDIKSHLTSWQDESQIRISSKLLTERKKLSKPICCNVDFYSGFVYSMLGIPKQLYTPIFAISSISGWTAHRMEELINEGKLIRPAYKYVGHHRAYRKLVDR